MKNFYKISMFFAFIWTCQFSVAECQPVKVKTLPINPVTLATKARALTPIEKRDMEIIHSETKPGIPYKLDMSNPHHYRYAVHTLARVGVTQEKSPEFFRRLEKAHTDGITAHNANGTKPKKAMMAINQYHEPKPQDLNFIGYFDQGTTAGTYEALAVSSVMGGTQVTHVSIELYDADNNHVYATNDERTSEYSQGENFQVPISGQNPENISNSIAKAMFAYVPMNSASGEPEVVYFSSEDEVDPTSACMSLPQYCVRNGDGNCNGQYETACTNTVPNETAIKVCWWRGSQADCDYWDSTAHPENFTFPLAGYTTYSTAPVSPPSGFVNIALQNPLKGGGCNVYFKQLGNLDPTNWTVDADNKKISWNFPATAFPNTGDCIEHYNGTQTYLWVSASVALQGSPEQPPGFGSIDFTSDRSQLGVPGVYIIPPMYIMQGCFVEGTKIIQGDGSKRQVQDFKGNHDETVLTGQGTRVLVTGTTKGTEPHKKMVRLKTANGRELMVTSTHPVITKDDKPVMAKNLKKGDIVKTKKGPSKLTSVSREKYAGKVYNLLVGKEMKVGENGMTLYANEILTGDSRMQDYFARQEQAKLKKDPSEVRKRLPKEWLTDFDNHQSKPKAK